MTNHPVRTLTIILVAFLALLGLDRLGLRSTREYLCAVRSEIREPDMSRFEALAGKRPAEPARAAEAASEARARPEAAPGSAPPAIFGPGALPAADPTDEPWWLAFLRTAKRLLSASMWTENLSWAEATPHTAQGSATVEALAHTVVENDPVLPHTGEMTFSQPIVRIPGTGFDFSFGLCYRSGFKYDGPIGKNWDHNWWTFAVPEGPSGPGVGPGDGLSGPREGVDETGDGFCGDRSAAGVRENGGAP